MCGLTDIKTNLQLFESPYRETIKTKKAINFLNRQPNKVEDFIYINPHIATAHL